MTAPATSAAHNPSAGIGSVAGLDKLQRTISDAGVRNFSATEICRLNHARLRPGEPGVVVPPSSMWPTMIPTLRLAEAIRAAWVDDIRLRGCDVTRCGISVISGYRPGWYNTRIGGAKESQHMRFAALDLTPINGEVGHFMRVAQLTVVSLGDSMRRVGFGRYDTFVHIDTGREQYTRWDERSERGKADHARYAIGGDLYNQAFPAQTGGAENKV